MNKVLMFAIACKCSAKVLTHTNGSAHITFLLLIKHCMLSNHLSYRSYRTTHQIGPWAPLILVFWWFLRPDWHQWMVRSFTVTTPDFKIPSTISPKGHVFLRFEHFYPTFSVQEKSVCLIVRRLWVWIPAITQLSVAESELAMLSGLTR